MHFVIQRVNVTRPGSEPALVIQQVPPEPGAGFGWIALAALPTEHLPQERRVGEYGECSSVRTVPVEIVASQRGQVL